MTENRLIFGDLHSLDISIDKFSVNIHNINKYMFAMQHYYIKRAARSSALSAAKILTVTTFTLPDMHPPDTVWYDRLDITDDFSIEHPNDSDVMRKKMELDLSEN